ncbi:Mpv17 / PMP22 family protein [Drechmeria coniospora]|uniref:Mpv17 / PMP22 family protein n=1 Tax=Drechmeria coniospora TaxID=98403 RepID=A0A151GJN9_DRECN|nr:Mpv17 / PMP22 family protein [Drechmeria coniospora]KYK57325.1 Mpv17 / PMP22 family protein [Drechmeria coniospora]
MPSPVVDATLQAAGLSLISNLCAQFIQAHQTQRLSCRAAVQQAPNLELRQLVRFLALQLITTPPNFQWQIYLEKRFPAYLPSTRGPRNKKDKDELELRSLEEAARVGYGSEPLGPVAVAPYKFSMRNTMMKWFVDCFTAGAIVNTVAFLVIMGMMKGQRVSQICDNVRTVLLAPFPPPNIGLFPCRTRGRVGVS